jgi:hypothetical protein
VLLVLPVDENEDRQWQVDGDNGITQ